jgi:hypothetical protein
MPGYTAHSLRIAASSATRRENHNPSTKGIAGKSPAGSSPAASTPEVIDLVSPEVS